MGWFNLARDILEEFTRTSYLACHVGDFRELSTREWPQLSRQRWRDANRGREREAEKVRRNTLEYKLKNREYQKLWKRKKRTKAGRTTTVNAV